MKKEEVRAFVDDIITNKICDGVTKKFIELDSLEKLELIMYCEKEYGVGIPESEVDFEWDTDQFVDYLYEIIYDH